MSYDRVQLMLLVAVLTRDSRSDTSNIAAAVGIRLQ
jgi:hypothetical protein